MPDLTDVKVGDALWVAPRDVIRRQQVSSGYSATVTKVGRKWLSTDGNSRFSRETGLVHAGQYASTSWAWHSEEEYSEHVALDRAWRDISHQMDRIYSPPDGMTVERIREARKLLGLEG